MQHPAGPIRDLGHIGMNEGGANCYPPRWQRGDVVAVPRSPERGDILWIDCNPQAGKEMKDPHPILVLSPRAFNERTGIVIGLPMTTSESDESNPFAVKFSGPRGIVSYVLCHQPKSFDWRARSAKPHPWKQAPENVFSEVRKILNQVIDLHA